MHLRPGKKPHKEPCAMNSNPAAAQPPLSIRAPGQAPRTGGGKVAISQKIYSLSPLSTQKSREQGIFSAACECLNIFEYE